MTDQAEMELDQTAATGTDTAQQSETASDKGAAQSPGATDTPETVAETDEQKNERVAREAAEKAEKRSRGVQKRIDELTAEKHAAARRADEALELVKQLVSSQGQKQAQQATTGEPSREQYESYEDFVIARAEYRAEQRAKVAIEESTRTTQEKQQRETAEQSQRTAAAAYQGRQQEFAKSTPDYFSVMEDADIAVPTPVYQAILRIPDGPMLAYHMAKNPELARQFTPENAEMHSFILGQMVATLKAPQKSSNAPPPGKPAASKVGSDNEPPSDPEKYRAWADKHLK